MNGELYPGEFEAMERQGRLDAVIPEQKMMTSEEAIGNLKYAIRWNDMPKKEALEMAIKALEQEACGDTISRHDSIAALKKHFSDDDSIETECGAYWHHGHVIEVLQGMPSVNPKQKMGHWIDVYGGCECSKCGCLEAGYSDYCPNCGAKMQEVQK